MGHTHNEDTRKHLVVIGITKILINIQRNC
jgi:hypothetical protein